MPNLNLPKYNLNINTPAPIFGTGGIVYQPGKYTTLTSPDLGNPYQNTKPDLSLKKPSDLKLDRPKPKSFENPSEPTKNNKKNIFIAIGVIALVTTIVIIAKNKN